MDSDELCFLFFLGFLGSAAFLFASIFDGMVLVTSSQSVIDESHFSLTSSLGVSARKNMREHFGLSRYK